MNMRLYWPKAEVLYGLWLPPPVKRRDCNGGDTTLGNAMSRVPGPGG
jgi:hypothetical protein